MRYTIITISVLFLSLSATSQSNVAFTKPLKIDNLDLGIIDIQDYLDDGKYVLLDFFTTWCAPCWNVHNSKRINNIYKEYGPESDNYILNVVGIEISGRTSIFDLHYNTEESYGDWLQGVDYPMVDLKTGIDINLFADAYLVNSYPTFIMICPDGAWYEIYSSSQIESNVEAILNGEISCPDVIKNDPSLISTLGKKYSCSNQIDFGIIHANFGSDTANVNEIELKERTIDGEELILDTILVESNFENRNLDTLYYSMTDINEESKYVLQFLNDSHTYSSDKIYFKTKSFLNSVDASSYTYDFDGTFENVQDTDRLFAFWLDRIFARNIFRDMPAEIILGKFNFGDSENLSLELVYSQATGDFSYDNKLEVIYSDNCGDSWNSLWSLESEELVTFEGKCSDDPEWKSIKIGLEELTGLQDILLGFKYHSGTECNVEFEEIRFITSVTSTNDPAVSKTESPFYPNPFQDILYVKKDFLHEDEIAVFDIMGQVVVHFEDAKVMDQFNFSRLENGVYFIHVSQSNKRYKVVKSY